MTFILSNYFIVYQIVDFAFEMDQQGLLLTLFGKRFKIQDQCITIDKAETKVTQILNYNDCLCDSLKLITNTQSSTQKFWVRKFYTT